MPISVEKTAIGAWIMIKKDLAVAFCIGDLLGLPSQIVTINLDGRSSLQAGEHSIECEATRSWRAYLQSQ